MNRYEHQEMRNMAAQAAAQAMGSASVYIAPADPSVQEPIFPSFISRVRFESSNLCSAVDRLQILRDKLLGPDPATDGCANALPVPCGLSSDASIALDYYESLVRRFSRLMSELETFA